MTVRGRFGSAKVAVLTITAEEFAATRRIFTTDVQIQGRPYYVPAISGTNDYDLVLRQATDRTNSPAAEAVADLVEYLSPEFLLVVGTAGGVAGRSHVALGDVVIADYVEYSEFRKRLPGQDLARKIPYDHPSLFLRDRFATPLRGRTDWIDLIDVPRPAAEPARMDFADRARTWFPRLLARALAPPRDPVNVPKAIEGNILSGEKIWGDPKSEELEALLREFDKAVAFDTESYGIARAVFWRRSSQRHYNPQYLVVRGVSDLVNAPGNEAQRRDWTEYAATAAACFARCLAEDLLRSEIWQ